MSHAKQYIKGLFKREPKVSLEGGVLNSDCTRSVIRKFHWRQHAYLVKFIVTTEATKKLLECVVYSLRQSVCLWVSIGRHIQARSEASPKFLPEGTDEFRVTVTN
jgi:hypothetical protein